MHPLPMASSPDGLISAHYVVITKTPGWEVLTTTSNVNDSGGGGGLAVQESWAPDVFHLRLQDLRHNACASATNGSSKRAPKAPFPAKHADAHPAAFGSPVGAVWC